MVKLFLRYQSVSVLIRHRNHVLEVLLVQFHPQLSRLSSQTLNRYKSCLLIVKKCKNTLYVLSRIVLHQSSGVQVYKLLECYVSRTLTVKIANELIDTFILDFRALVRDDVLDFLYYRWMYFWHWWYQFYVCRTYRSFPLSRWFIPR